MRIVLPSGTPAELFVPEDVPPTRGVVLFPDIGGLRPLFDELVQWLATENGWAVIAPEPFPGQELPTIEDRFAAIPGLDDHDVLGDAVAAAAHLGVEPVAVMGFCMGGMYALKAAGNGRFDKAVAFYGMITVPAGWKSPGHGEPLDAVAAEGASPVLAIVGTEDGYTPAHELELLEAAGATVVRYDGAEHGFVHDASRPSHRKEDAADAWQRVTVFLDPSDS